MEKKKTLGIGVVGCGSTGIQSVLQHTCEEDKGDLVYTAAVIRSIKLFPKEIKRIIKRIVKAI